MVNKRVLSGIQPTGNLHLGNYLGAMENFVDMQNEYECFYMLADLHAITVKVDPSSLKENIINTA
jgi:tryptophanyl-tRNA synthetase